MKTLLTTTAAIAISATASFAGVCTNEDRGPSLNPTELSAHKICILKNFRADEVAGTIGSIFFVKVGDDYVSFPVNDLRIHGFSEETQMNYVNSKVQAHIDVLKAEHEVAVKAATAKAVKKAVEGISPYVSILKTDLAALEAELEQAQADNAEALANLDFANNTIQTQIADIATKAQKITELNSEISSLETSIFNLETKVEELEDAATIDAETIANINGQLSAANTKIAQLEGTIMTVNGTLSMVEEELQTKVEALGVANANLDIAEAELVKVQNDINAALSESKSTWTEALTALVNERDALKTEVSELKAEIEDMFTADDLATAESVAFAKGVDSVTFLQSSFDDGYTKGVAATKADPMWNNEDGINQSDVDAVTYTVTINGENHVIGKDSNAVFTIDTEDGHRSTVEIVNGEVVVTGESAGTWTIDPEDGSYNVGFDAGVASVDITSDNAAAIQAAKDAVVMGEIPASAPTLDQGVSFDWSTDEVVANDSFVASIYGTANSFGDLYSDQDYAGNFVDWALAEGYTTIDILDANTLVGQTLDALESAISTQVRAAMQVSFEEGYDRGYNDGYTDGFADGVASVGK